MPLPKRIAGVFCALGGRLEIRSSIGLGTTVIAGLPRLWPATAGRGHIHEAIFVTFSEHCGQRYRWNALPTIRNR